MTKQIVFHLGDPKTGTTSIQDTLATGNWICARPLSYSAKLNHIPLAQSLLKNAPAAGRKHQFTMLADHIARTDAELFVVSAEFFESVDPLRLQAALAEFLPEHAKTARFIAYVRPHADRLVSAFAERLKAGYFAGSLEQLHQDTLERGRFVYTPRFLKWRATFGDRFTLRPMIRAGLFRNCVVRDFLNLTFEGAEFSLIDDPNSNESLALEDLLMLREFHSRIPSAPEVMVKARISTGLAFARLLSAVPRQSVTRPAMSRDLARRVMDDYRRDAAELDAAFFQGTPIGDALSKAADKATDQPQSLDIADYFTPSGIRLLHVLAETLADMLLKSPDIVPENWRRLQRDGLDEKAAMLARKSRHATAGPPERVRQ